MQILDWKLGAISLNLALILSPYISQKANRVDWEIKIALALYETNGIITFANAG